jgi:hypothetical protein
MKRFADLFFVALVSPAAAPLPRLGKGFEPEVGDPYDVHEVSEGWDKVK